MTDQELELKLRERIRSERKITIEILQLINLVEDRRLHLKRGYSTIFKWLVEEFGYSEPAAYRRVSAAKLLREVPDVAVKLENGTLNLTNLVKVRSYQRAGAKVQELLQAVEGKNSAQADVALVKLCPGKEIHRTSQTVVSESHTRLAVTFANEDLRDIERTREILSGSMEKVTHPDALMRAVRFFLQHKDPLRSTSAAAKPRVTKQAEGKCEYVDPQTGKRCVETFRFQVDHDTPRALGGSNAPENLRGLCRAHNLYMSEQKLGKSWANSWRRH